MRNTYEKKEAYRNRMQTIRQWKRDDEEANRWKRFTISREAFDEELEYTLDVYELIERNLNQ